MNERICVLFCVFSNAGATYTFGSE